MSGGRAYDAAAVRAALPGSTMWRDIRVVPETGSTSSDLADLARAGAPEGTLVVADHQVSGRGRLDRTWHTPPGTGIAVSMLFRPVDVPVSRWPWLPLLVGVAVAEAVHTGAAVPVTLKWPNDVVIEGRKLAGILAEVVPGGVVVGVGLNVSVQAADLPPTATSLALEGVARTCTPEGKQLAAFVDRLDLLATLLVSVDQRYGWWRGLGGDPAATAAAYRPLCTTLGSQVRVGLPSGGRLVGLALDIDHEGRLVVRTPSGDHAVGVGDVVHVRRELT